jgi:undecaprenyl-diphosphatase
MTPDTLLIFFWVLSLYWLHRCWKEGHASDWLVLGVFIGLGLLCKYAISLIYIPALLLLITTTEGKERLRTVWPYLGCGLSLVFFLPVLIWNSRHDWVMFRHDLGHIGPPGGSAISVFSLLEFCGGQLAAITPVLCVMMIYLVIRNRRQDAFCFWLIMPILVGFMAKAAFGKVQANWPMVGWLAGLPGLGRYMLDQMRCVNKAKRRWIWAGLAVPVVATVLIHMPMVLLRVPWPQGLNPFSKLIGWRELGRMVSGIARDMDRPHFVVSDHYMVASELAFYVQGRPYVYCVNLGRRMNQYDIWQDFRAVLDQAAIYVSNRRMPESLAKVFDVVREDTITIHGPSARPMKRFLIYRCYGFRGLEQGRPSSY